MKLKETALETSTNSFLEKERDLQNKIEDLESKVEEHIQVIPFQKVCYSIFHVMHHKIMHHKSTCLTCLIFLSWFDGRWGFTKTLTWFCSVFIIGVFFFSESVFGFVHSNFSIKIDRLGCCLVLFPFLNIFLMSFKFQGFKSKFLLNELSHFTGKQRY